MKKNSGGFLRFFSIVTLTAFTLTTLFEHGALAIPVGSTSTASGNAAGQLGQIAESAGAVQSFQADLFTGRAQTGVPIFVPPGRKNVQPNLNLSYSSSGGNGWLGTGWGLDMGFIQRDVKKGVPKYDSTDKYIFSFQGVSSELISVGTNEYRAKDEALFLKFVFNSSSNSWTVTDKSGTKHTFGDASGSRQSNSLGTFKWLLSKVSDTSGNYMSISYTTDQGELYVSSIEYNGNETQSFAHTHKVEFTIEDRSDKSFSYISGAKVETNKRLNQIQVKVKNGSGTYQLSRKYTLAYTASTPTTRSLLTSVTECGTDGTTCLPAVTFTYQGVSNGFDSMIDYTGVDRVFTSSDFDYIATTNSSNETIVNVADINGDGYLDRVLCNPDTSVTNWKVQYGGSSGFGTAQNFGTVSTNAHGNPSRCMQYDYEPSSGDKNQASDLTDLNGDGLPDHVLADTNGWKVQYNNGSGFDTAVTLTTIETFGISEESKYIRVRTTDGKTQTELADINGDGLPDRILADNSSTNWKVQLNTGSGFASSVNWGPIDSTDFGSLGNYPRFINSTGQGGADLMDINGDGLPDRLFTDTVNWKWKVQWNTGSGFTSPASDWTPIQQNTGYGVQSVYVRRQGHIDGYTISDVMDLNGDGLADRVIADDSNTNWEAQWNTGTGLANKANFGPIDRWESSSGTEFIRYMTVTAPFNMKLDVMDLNGDGMPDRVQSKSGNTVWKIQKNKNPGVDLMKTVSNGRGGKTTMTYSPSTGFDNTDTNGKQRLPFPIQVVTQVTQEDGMGNSYSTSYSYKGGLYDPTERELRGFREVMVTDAAGTKTIHTFHQSTCKKGRLISKEIRNSADNLFSKEETTWSETHPYTGVHFAYVSQQDNYVYDGDASYKQTRQEFTYDSYGNLTSKIERGDTGVSGDERKTVSEYVFNTTDYILNTLKKTTIYDTDLTTIKAEQYFYYDGATSITTAPVKGLLTKQEDWLNTASGCGTAGVCTNNPKTTMTYDSYGLVATITDARGYVTTNTHDSTYHLFLIEIENGLTQTKEFTYDPWLAQILTSTDQNGQVTETVYDTLGRATKLIAPLDSSSEPTQEFAYDYPNLGTCGTTCVTKITTKIKSSVPGQTFSQLITYTFMDGLGREIQRRIPAESGSQQIVSGGLEFNSRGLIFKNYVPYFETSSTSFVATDTSKPKATLTYDAVGRRTRIDYPDGTNSEVVFSDFVRTTTDQRGKQMRYTDDAYGRPAKVEEFNSGSTYTTTYEYDVRDNLKKTTDNAGNQTMITYDSLSRKTGMVDPNMGSWSYAYDLNNNLVSQTDAKSQTISFTYDALNRVTLKDLPSGETDVTYNYDSAPSGYSGQTGYWAGRLAKISDASGDQEILYDKQGRVLKDKKTVDSIAYEFVRTYDSMARVRTLTYPDTEIVTYTYNNFGDIETISGVKNSVTTDYIKEVNYNASGQIIFTKYGNNVTSDYTYNSNTQRLSSILTKKPDGTTKLQDLSYTFDNNGNVTQIADTVNSMSQTFTYDDLNRLTQAVGSSYGTQTFAYDSIGNMTSKAGRTMAYGEGAPGPQAVTSVTWSGSTNYPTFCRDLGSGSCALGYDANGNMTTRGQDILTYDSENRLKEIKVREGESGTTNYTLKPGWNVISFTHLPDDRSISNVLSSLTFGTDYDQVSYWDASAPGTDKWKHWVNDSDFNDFTQFEYGKTYEIYNKSGVDKSLSVTGKTSAIDITHNIVAGDNFISPAVKTATNVSTILSGLTQGTHYSDVKRFNATSQTWESYQGGAFTQFEPGKGYNIIGLTNASFSYGKTENTTTFVYDSTGERVKKTAGSTTTVYLGRDYDITGSTSTKYIFLGDRRIANKDSSGTTLYYHEDHINSSNVITDSSGNQAALYEYTPYGDTATHTGSASVKHQFTGHEKDESTGLLYMGARFMDPQLGRFITPDAFVQDSLDPQSFNRYAYARNNPINYIDPTGHFWFFVAIFFAIVSIATAVAAKIAANNGHLNAARTLGIISMAAAAISLIAAATAFVTAPTAVGAIGTAAPAAPAAGSAGGAGAGAAASGGTGGAVAGGATASAATQAQLVEQLAQAMAQYGASLQGAAQLEGVVQLSSITIPAAAGGSAGINATVMIAVISSDAGVLYSSSSYATLTDSMTGPHPGNLIRGSEVSGAPMPGAGTSSVRAFNPALTVAAVASGAQSVDNVMRKGRGGKKKDITQVDKAAKKAGIKDRHGFGDFIEAAKQSLGKRGNDNYGWRKLLELAEEFKQSGGK